MKYYLYISREYSLNFNVVNIIFFNNKIIKCYFDKFFESFNNY